jgi:hypothetical protein
MIQRKRLSFAALCASVLILFAANTRASTISLAQTDYRVNEPNGSVTITVKLDRSDDPDPGDTVMVNYKTIPGTATPPGDYTTEQGTLTFDPGETSKIITVPITNDNAVENEEQFSLILYDQSADRFSATLATTTATITIIDDDSTSGTIGFASAKYSINENPQFNGGAASVIVTVTRSGDTSTQVDVNYATSPISATENVDYQGQAGTLTFLPGQTSKQISIPVFNDGLPEGDEKFVVNLSPNFGGISSTTVTIVDDDASTVNFSSANYSISENAGVATITLLRTGSTSGSTTVNVVTVGGTATPDVDYVSTARSVTFNAGDTAATFQVPIIDDQQVEGTEFFSISLAARANSGAVIGATGTTRVDIIDDEGANTVEFLGTDFSVLEDDAALITVRLNRRGDTGSVTVNYFTTTGSANANTDYTPVSGTLTFAPGETIKTFLVPTTPDNLLENTETVGVVLANPTNAFLGANSAAVLSIIDEDAAGTVQFSTATYAVFEGSGTVTLTVLLDRTGDSSKVVHVPYTTVPGSATEGEPGDPNADFTRTASPPLPQLTFQAGSSIATITVPITNDQRVESPETFSVVLGQPDTAALGARSAATVTIQDDDGLNVVEFAAAEYGVLETFGPDQPQAAVTLTIIAQRGGDPNQALSVDVLYGATGDTAAVGVDYTPPTTTRVVFPPGVSQQTVTIAIVNRAEAQGNTFFTARLVDAGEFTIIGEQAATRVTILDNSGPNTVQLLSPSVRFREGQQAAIAIPVFRTGSFAKNGTTVNFTTEIRNGDTAQDGVNFVQTTGSVFFDPITHPGVVVDNEHEKFIVIPVPDNNLVQGDVTFHVTLISSDVASIGNVGTTRVTIEDDDLGNVVQFGAPNYSVGESAGGATVTVKLTQSGDALRPTSVDFAATSITAYGGFDFIPVTGTLVFSPGETTKTIFIPIENDLIPEPTETFRVTLSNPGTGAVIGSQSTTIVSILDNDVASTVQFSPAAYNVAETAGTVTLTVVANRMGDPNAALQVGYRTVAATAVANADYAPASGTITFAAGETQKNIVIGIINDTLIEGPEDFFVLLDNPGLGVLIGTSDTATVTIGDDDSPNASIGFSQASYDVDEGAGFANLTVTRSGGLGVSATVNYATTDGTAVAGTNYVKTEGSVTFGVGEVSKVIQIPIIDDPTADPTLTFTVTLTSPTGTGFIGGQSTATVNIIDNDATVFRFNPTQYTVDEGAGTVTVIVEAVRVGDPSSTLTVDFSTADGTAVEGVKYERTAGQLTFGPGVTRQNITIPIIDESFKEGTQNFFVNLSNPQGTGTPRLAAARTATVTIIDNDATTFQFTSGNYSVQNSAGAATLTVTLSRLSSPTGTFTVDYSTSDISAVAGTDYTATSGTLVFGPGETSKTITIPITPQPTGQPSRQFRVTLSNPSNGADLGQLSQAIVTITNFDLSTKLVNISTRGPVQSGDAVMIAGFIVQGDAPKLLVLRGIGPSLTQRGVANALEDPTLTLMDSNGTSLVFNDDYAALSSLDQQTLTTNSLTPTDSRESAIVATVGPGSYTVILRGKSNGVGLIEVYDLSETLTTRLVNISTRGQVEEGDNGAMIAGFIVGAPQNMPGTAQRVAIRAIGPSLKDKGIDGALLDPTLEIYRGSTKILENDNWKNQTEDGAGSKTDIQASGLQPTNDKEAVILTTLDPGSYTAVIRGKAGTTGVALAEVYQLQ